MWQFNNLGSWLMVLCAAWVIGCVFLEGVPNNLDLIAYWLHRIAKSMRSMHANRERTLARLWVGELEKGDSATAELMTAEVAE